MSVYRHSHRLPSILQVHVTPNSSRRRQQVYGTPPLITTTVPFLHFTYRSPYVCFVLFHSRSHYSRSPLLSDYDIITHYAPYLSCVYVCCLAQIYRICSNISTWLFPPLSARVRSVGLFHQPRSSFTAPSTLDAILFIFISIFLGGNPIYRADMAIYVTRTIG